jgi:hypothetical protein
VAVDGRSNVVASGYFQGTANTGARLLTSAGSVDIYVAKFGP